MKTETIEATIDAWRKEPGKALGSPVVTARAEDRPSRDPGRGITWQADLPPAWGGSNRAPSLTALLLGALAGCAVVFVRDTLAPLLGIRVDAVGATVWCETDAPPSVGTWRSTGRCSRSHPAELPGLRLTDVHPVLAM